MYYITKTYGKWSSSTLVDVLEAPWLKGEKRRYDQTAKVYHPASKEVFEIPATLLRAKRDRQEATTSG